MISRRDGSTPAHSRPTSSRPLSSTTRSSSVAGATITQAFGATSELYAGGYDVCPEALDNGLDAGTDAAGYGRLRRSGMARMLRWIACAVMALFMLAGAPAQAATVNVEVGSDYFKAKSITVNKGDTVTWNWVGGTHNVRSTDGSGVLNSANLQKPATYSHTFSEVPGTYTYECTRHGGMTGSVTVVGA